MDNIINIDNSPLTSINKKNIEENEEETEKQLPILIDISKINTKQLEKNINKIINQIDINELFENVLTLNEERIFNPEINNYSIINKKKESKILNCKFCNKEYTRPKCLKTHEKICKKIK